MSRKTKTYKKHQKFYKMKGCSKKTRKKYLGGSRSISDGDINLAWPAKNVPSVPNPFLAYTGKGGACNDRLTPSLNIPANIGGQNKIYPSTSPNERVLGTNFLNPGMQRGGKKKRKGGCGPMCMAPLLMLGGKQAGGKEAGGKLQEKVGGLQLGGNPGIPYPDGRVGGAWSANPAHWPGVSGIQGDRNYLPVNTYKHDISRQIINEGAQPPFLGKPTFLRGGGRRSRKHTKQHSRKQKGGALSNFIGQDLINLGRQFQFGVGSAYNALAGHAPPVNPLPWNQLPNRLNMNTLKNASI